MLFKKCNGVEIEIKEFQIENVERKLYSATFKKMRFCIV